MAELITFDDGKEGVRFPLSKDSTHIGRGVDNDIVIKDELISKNHAVIDRQQPEDGSHYYRFRLRDLKSTNGTLVNGEAITQITLWNGDLIRLGTCFFKFNDDDQDDQELSKTTELRKSWIPGVYYTKKKD